MAVDKALAPVLALVARSSLGASQRISSSQLQALLTIDRFGSLNLTTLAEALAVLPSSATRLCERMLAADLVTKTPAVLDRREVVIALTSHGQQLIEQIEQARRTELQLALTQMPEHGRRALLAGLTALGAELGDGRAPTATGALG